MWQHTWKWNKLKAVECTANISWASCTQWFQSCRVQDTQLPTALLRGNIYCRLYIKNKRLISIKNSAHLSCLHSWNSTQDLHHCSRSHGIKTGGKKQINFCSIKIMKNAKKKSWKEHFWIQQAAIGTIGYFSTDTPDTYQMTWSIN